MGSYAFYLIFPIIIGMFVFLNNGKKGGKLLFFLLLFLSMFRGDHVGGDTMNYMDYDTFERRLYNLNEVQEFGIFDFSSRVEVSTNYIYYLIDLLNLPNRTIILFFSVSTFLFLMLSIKRYKVSIGWVLFYFVIFGHYYYSLSAARQITAVCVVLYAYSFLHEEGKKRYLFILFVLLATTIHASAIYSLPFYFLRYLKVNRGAATILVLCVSFVFIISQGTIVTRVISGLNMEYILRRIDSYGGAVENSTVGFIFLLVKLFSITCLFYFSRKEKETDLYDNLFLMSILLLFVLSGLSVYINRICYYITIIDCIFLTKFLNIRKVKDKPIQLCYMIFVIFYMYDAISIATNGLGSGYYLMFQY